MSFNQSNAWYVTCCMILKSSHFWKRQPKVLPVSELLEGRWEEGGTGHTRWILWRCSSCKDAARPRRILNMKSRVGKPSQESKFQSFKLLWTHQIDCYMFKILNKGYLKKQDRWGERKRYQPDGQIDDSNFFVGDLRGCRVCDGEPPVDSYGCYGSSGHQDVCSLHGWHQLTGHQTNEPFAAI